MHLAQTEIALGFRARMTLVTPGFTSQNFDQDAWLLHERSVDGPTALHRQMPDISRKVITGTSHWPHMDKPQDFNRLLDDFLAWMA